MKTVQCTWKVDNDGVYGTECGNRFEFTTDGPKENGFKYCPYCGLGLRALLKPCKPISLDSSVV